MAHSLGFMAMGLISRLSPANHSDSGSFLVVCTWLSQPEGIQEDKWTGGLLSPFDLSQILPIDGGLLVPCSLPGAPVVK